MVKLSPLFSLNAILGKAAQEEPLSRGEILYLLGLKERKEQEMLFGTARKLRSRYFGDKLFLYGFIYFSTWCRNDCTFCNYRASNRLCSRYRKTDGEVLEAATNLAESGVHLLDLTMGEDPFYFHRENGFIPLLRLVKKVKRETGLPIMISWGVTPDEVLEKLFEVGADWFACYQETHAQELFKKLRLGQDYHCRFEAKRKAIHSGMLIEEGILSGVGESLANVARSIETMRQMNPHQARVMNFVPQRGTPLADIPPPLPIREQIIIAVLRLLLPHRLIPASLDVEGIAGLRGKLEAGANVVTSLIPPSSELKGVAQSELGISEGHRTVKAILPVLDGLGLRKANLEDYLVWIDDEKKRLPRHFFSVEDDSNEGGYCWGKAARG